LGLQKRGRFVLLPITARSAGLLETGIGSTPNWTPNWTPNRENGYDNAEERVEWPASAANIYFHCQSY